MTTHVMVSIQTNVSITFAAEGAETWTLCGLCFLCLNRIGKGKVAPVHTVKACGGWVDAAPSF
jgi:hypothetical protein